ncbi:unnamed protein product [Clavelina lepadiformis]|uniref:CAP-Gly domain-containing protein n=1 Tax=Clavelina lepadiformis TaxID=159417 RepID=A0ABP0F1A9_CLALP
MAEGSSVDELGRAEADGLNLASEFIKEESELESSWDNYLEDSVDMRAAKALKLESVNDLFPRRKMHKGRQILRYSRSESPAQSLAGIIYSSMTSDMRSAACSVSPSPNRLYSGHSSNSSARSASITPFSCNTPISHKSSTPRKRKKSGRFNQNGSLDLKETMTTMESLQLLPNDDSFQSEPELDYAFSEHRQTMDILTGHLNERRVAHGGYGTPSSYASEQELNMYFNSTPALSETPDMPYEQINKAETSLETMARIEQSMGEQVISLAEEDIFVSEDVSVTTKAPLLLVEQDMPRFEENENQIKAKRYSPLAEKFNLFAEFLVDDMESFTGEDETPRYDAQQYNEDKTTKDLEVKKHRRNSDSALTRKSKKHSKKDKKAVKTTVKGENMLLNMLKTASASVIDNVTSDSILQNLTNSPSKREKHTSDTFSEFDSFQERLKEFKEEYRLPDSQQADEHLLSNKEVVDEVESTISDNLNNEETSPVESNTEDKNISQHQKCSVPQMLQSSSDIDIIPCFSSSDNTCSNSIEGLSEEDDDVGFYDKNIIDIKSLNVEKQQLEDAVRGVLEQVQQVLMGPSFENRTGSEENDLNEEESDKKALGLQSQKFKDDCEEMVTTSFSHHQSPIYFERDNDRGSDVLTARLKTDSELESETTTPVIDVEEYNRFDKNAEGKNLVDDGDSNCVFEHKPKDVVVPVDVAYYDTLSEETQTKDCLIEQSEHDAVQSSESWEVGLEENVQQTLPTGFRLPLSLTTFVKYSEPSYCCDSGTESGYGTTTDCKPHRPSEVMEGELNTPASTSNVKASECPVTIKDVDQRSSESSNEDDKNYSVKPVSSSSYSFGFPFVHCETCLTPKDTISNNSPIGAVFEVKASALERCIESYDKMAEKVGKHNLPESECKDSGTKINSTPSPLENAKTSNHASVNDSVLEYVAPTSYSEPPDEQHKLSDVPCFAASESDKEIITNMHGKDTDDLKDLKPHFQVLTKDPCKSRESEKDVNTAMTLKYTPQTRIINASSQIEFDEYGDPIVESYRTPRLTTNTEEWLAEKISDFYGSDCPSNPTSQKATSEKKKLRNKKTDLSSSSIPSIVISSPVDDLETKPEESQFHFPVPIPNDDPNCKPNISECSVKKDLTTFEYSKEIFDTYLQSNEADFQEGNSRKTCQFTTSDEMHESQNRYQTSNSKDGLITKTNKEQIDAEESTEVRENCWLPHHTSSYVKTNWEKYILPAYSTISEKQKTSTDSNHKSSNKQGVIMRAEFSSQLKGKYKNLDDQINRILNPTPSPPLCCDRGKEDQDNSFNSQYKKYPLDQVNKVKRKVLFEDCAHVEMSCQALSEYKKESHRYASNSLRNARIKYSAQSIVESDRKPRTSTRRNIFPDAKKHQHQHSSNGEEISTTCDIRQVEIVSPHTGHQSHFTSHPSNITETTISYDREDLDIIEEALQFIRQNLNRDDYLIKNLERQMKDSWQRIKTIESAESTLEDDDHEFKLNMSNGTRTKQERSNKVRALEEVVGLLKKHVQHRELEINDLGSQLRQSNDKIRNLEKKLDQKNTEESRVKSLRHDKENIHKKLKSIQNEREELKRKIDLTKIEKEDALKASRKAREDLHFERKKQDMMRSNGLTSHPQTKKHQEKKELREKVDELELLNKSSTSELEKTEVELASLKRENRSMRMNGDQVLLDLKTDNTIMREKLDRMHELSTENLLLQSDAADYQAELNNLRLESKDLRGKVYELEEEKRQLQSEVYDLRRFIELLKANKTGDSRQDLLNKIEYYQMEHDRLMDEVRRLKHRLGEISPRASYSPRSQARSTYPGPSSNYSPTKQNVRFSHSLERGRSPVSDAMAAGTASSLGAVRIVKERSLSPTAALNLRDLTMERYHQHMEGPESPRSVDSDCTEFLLKPQHETNGHAGLPSTILQSHNDSDDDDDDVELNLPHMQNRKLSDSVGSNHTGLRHCSSERMACSNNGRRSCSPTNPGGFRSLSPCMTSTQNGPRDTARDRYPTTIKKSLPRRAFAPRSPADLMLGYCIKFTRPGGKLSRGTVRYIGHLPTRDEIFVGVELDGYDGKHSGTFQGKKYFTCPTNKGIFTPFSKVIMAWE